jgi:hypothetical protein
MSQEISTSPRTNPRVSIPSIAQPQAQPWSASNDAEQLMDEVFSDLDRLLAGGASLPEVAAAAPEQMVALQPLVVPPISLPPGFLPAPEPAPTNNVVTADKAAETSSYFDRLLWGAALAAVGASGVLWLVSKDILKLPFLPAAPTPVASQPSSTNPADAKFVDYMQRSLTAIDKRPAGSPTALQSGSRLPAPGGVPLAPTQAPPTVLERVYIPVFPPQNSVVQISPGLLAPRPPISPVSPSAKPPATESASRASSSARTESAPEPRAERSTREERNTTPAEAPAVASSSASGRTLIGILELGENSAALFEINGDTQRVSVGETIGGSGWTLVKVENQQAIVRRNGVVQSLYVGSRF